MCMCVCVCVYVWVLLCSVVVAAVDFENFISTKLKTNKTCQLPCSVYPSVCLSVCQFVCLPVSLSVCRCLVILNRPLRCLVLTFMLLLLSLILVSPVSPKLMRKLKIDEARTQFDFAFWIQQNDERQRCRQLQCVLCADSAGL